MDCVSKCNNLASQNDFKWGIILPVYHCANVSTSLLNLVFCYQSKSLRAQRKSLSTIFSRPGNDHFVGENKQKTKRHLTRTVKGINILSVETAMPNFLTASHLCVLCDKDHQRPRECSTRPMCLLSKLLWKSRRADTMAQTFLCSPLLLNT